MTVRILIGDVRTKLAEIPDESVHCVVTSPPYWGLRDYGTVGQLGLEATYPEYVETIVAVFREVRRVLRADGTLWLNMGDSYASSNGSDAERSRSTLQGGRSTQAQARSAGPSMSAPSGRGHRGRHEAAAAGKQSARVAAMGPVTQPNRMPQPNLKPKDLGGIPWRVAFALQDDGWWLRQDIIWSKPNPMPESVTDRCTKAHEYLFLLTKSERYYFDQEAILEASSPNTHARLSQNVEAQIGSARAHAGGKTNGNMKAVSRKLATPGSGIKNNSSMDGALSVMPDRRNKRSVWTIATEAFAEAHFATFPQALVEPCILAGCPVGGTVLDPFLGSGTTALVADRLGRDCIGIELNPAYAEIATGRLRAALAPVEGGAVRPAAGLPLFGPADGS